MVEKTGCTVMQCVSRRRQESSLTRAGYRTRRIKGIYLQVSKRLGVRRASVIYGLVGKLVVANWGGSKR